VERTAASAVMLSAVLFFATVATVLFFTAFATAWLSLLLVKIRRQYIEWWHEIEATVYEHVEKNIKAKSKCFIPRQRRRKERQGRKRRRVSFFVVVGRDCCTSERWISLSRWSAIYTLSIRHHLSNRSIILIATGGRATGRLLSVRMRSVSANPVDTSATAHFMWPTWPRVSWWNPSGWTLIMHC